MLSAALLTRSGAVGKGASGYGRWGYPVAAVLLACVIAGKPPYLALAAMLIFPLPFGLTGRPLWVALLRRSAVALLVSMPALLWTAYAVLHVATPLPRLPYEAGPLWPGVRPAVFTAIDPAAQLHVLLTRPSLALTLPWDFFINTRWWLVWGFIGIFTEVPLLIPKNVIEIWELALLAALCADGIKAATTPRVASLSSCTMMLLAVLVCAWSVVLSQYFAWTPAGNAMIEGPQGRYLLPILPLLAVAIPYETAGDSAPWRVLLRSLSVFAASLDMTFIPQRVLGPSSVNTKAPEALSASDVARGRGTSRSVRLALRNVNRYQVKWCRCQERVRSER